MNSEDLLSIEIAGIKFRNPVITTAGPTGWCGERLKEAGLMGAAGVTTRSIVPQIRLNPRPSLAVYSKAGSIGDAITFGAYYPEVVAIGMENIEMYTEKTKEEWIQSELKIAKQGGARVIASVAAYWPEDQNEFNKELEKVSSLARDLSKAGADFIELNLGCPHGPRGHRIISTDPKLSYKCTKTVKDSIGDTPLIIKMSPHAVDPVPIAQMVERAGADAISGINTLLCLIGIDVEKEMPILPTYGGYSGPAIKPIGLRFVSSCASAIKIPIIGIGGIWSWREAMEYIMAGATAVGINTAVILKGLGVIKEISQGLELFLRRKGYSSIIEVRGKALSKIVEIDRVFEDVDAKKKIMINDIDCLGCGSCVSVCAYQALEIEDKIAIVRGDRCLGCGLCLTVCKSNAIKWVIS